MPLTASSVVISALVCASVNSAAFLPLATSTPLGSPNKFFKNVGDLSITEVSLTVTPVVSASPLNLL